MATTFETILNRAQRAGVTETRSREAIDWYRAYIRKNNRRMNSQRTFREEKDNMVGSWTNTGPGQIYMVHYDPKHKKTLPYYDTFPLIIPIERYKDGLLGINLHYLPPILRAKLLDALYDTLTNESFNDNTRMKVNYGIVKSFSQSGLVKPTIKRYLGGHFRSRFIRIPAENWTSAVFLPVEAFEKASKSKVWSDSRKRIT